MRATMEIQAAAEMTTVSIIIPTLNEAESIGTMLKALQPLRDAGHQIIVADGGSSDKTVQLATPYADRVIASARGRALQMNSGAQVASGDILLFLHADSRLPELAVELLCKQLALSGKDWGRFDVSLRGKHLMFRLIERLMNWRSRLTGIATGDQGIFVHREIFEALGGYPEIALMEDIALSKKLKTLHRPLCLSPAISTSSRRWERHGIWRTILLMWRLRLGYFLGVSPHKLAQRYPSGSTAA